MPSTEPSPRRVRSRRVRSVTGTLAWAAAVVVATAIGLTAVGAIGDGIVGPGRQPLSPAEVDARLAAAASVAPRADPAPATTPAPAPTAPSGAPEAIVERGGTVVARCVDGAVEVVSAAPDQGFRVHGGGDRDRVRFESDDVEVELRLACRDGRPVAEVRVDD